MKRSRFSEEQIIAILDVLADLFIEHGAPEHIRSDNGPEFVPNAVREWLGRRGITTLYIEPGNAWKSVYVNSFNARLLDELLNGEIFYSLEEVRIITGWWRDHRALGAPGRLVTIVTRVTVHGRVCDEPRPTSKNAISIVIMG